MGGVVWEGVGERMGVWVSEGGEGEIGVGGKVVDYVLKGEGDG